ncbi:MAG: portal protein [Nanoarchaeota archaeon]|nr:portal protein [Nanoarchaeota archaeon]
MSLSEDSVKLLLAEQTHLKTERFNRDNLLQYVGNLVMPSNSDITETSQEGDDKSYDRYDDTAVLANNKRASALKGILANPETKWIEIHLKGQEVDPTSELKEYLQKMTLKFIAILKNPRSKFYNSLDKIALDDGSYGISACFVQQSKKELLNFRTFSYRDFVFSEDDEGNPNRIFVSFTMTLQQAVAKFGLKNLHSATQEKYKDHKNHFDKMEFIHCVVPRGNRTIAKAEKEKRHKRFAGYFLEKDNNHLVDESGYDAMPYVIFRGRVRSGEVYPDSPAINSIATIRLLNYIKYLQEQGAEISALGSPLVARNDAVMGTEEFDLSAGALNIVNVRAGTPLNAVVSPIYTQRDIRPNNELIAESRTIIDEFFMVSAFEAMRKNNMSATEAVINNNRDIRNASPTIARLFAGLTEVLELAMDILIKKEITNHKLEKESIFGELPEEIDFEQIDFVFKSPIARAMREEGLQALQILMQTIGMLAQIDPSVALRVNADEGVKIVADWLETPAQLLNDDEYVAEAKQAKAEQDAQNQKMAMIQQGAEIAKTAGDANKAFAE